ncbi:hypothetical protein WN55_05602 [Dufourea novaeangliae]|uniref:Uncharacterized protein n=1 Tax=Dufourea novaeangliae TaxID=178035 RepID=A0A154PN48_DUFNO|nr:hypothetical protein WN55_05602 [Dufourea novaeangliae]
MHNNEFSASQRANCSIRNTKGERALTTANGIHLFEWNIHVRFLHATALSSLVITDTQNVYVR